MLADDRFDELTGILLAAGKGTRFDPTGAANKLQHPFAGGESIAVIAAKNLLAVLPEVIAVVRPESTSLAQDLEAAGCRVTFCHTADDGMAASLVHALSEARNARGWLIALADMPYVRPATIQALVVAIRNGAQIAAPVHQGRRGNPVAFGRKHLEHLLALRGDEGARRLLKTFPMTEIPTDDPGIIQDIDTLDDLPRSA